MKPNLTCPACDQPAKSLVNGVCVSCKANFESGHKRIDVKWQPSDFAYHAPITHIESAPVLMDEEDTQKKQRDDDRASLLFWFKRNFRMLTQYKGNKELAICAFALAMDWGDLIGCESAVEVAAMLFKNPKKKAAATKAILLFQDTFEIPRTPGQRSEIGRQSMGKARKTQLKAK